MKQSTRDRVYAAAEQISAKRRPTVSTVRAAAGVSNADATRYLREWSEEKRAAAGQITATPAPLLEAAARLAGTAWAEAAILAAERHAAVEASWTQERLDKDTEFAELVDDLDRAAGEQKAAGEKAAAEIAALQEHVAALATDLEEARTAERTVQAASAETASLLTAAQAHGAALQSAYDALLARIPAAQEPTAGN
ncbi:DNA-binding protein [Arthrobacter sp. PAMC25284]|uniref:DNA-binding protein n=1 Tax=Arthrobacter sp. PAMC25284 TaxID=2861279 RepID=UPI002158A475|nr:DNA-binding protein [Arthrobacter sp. PAMC25284]